MILEEYLEITPVGRNYQYYKDLGYEVHKGVPIQVKIEDVQDGCSSLERIKCDCCGKIEIRKHKAIIDTRKAYGKDLCVECSRKENKEKVKKTNLERYGVEYPMQSKEIKEKAKQTTREHYGTDYSFQNKEVNKKARQSFKDKYGVDNPLQSKEIMKKTIKTNIEKYGCENPFGNNEVKQKIKKYNLEKYGVENVSQVQEIKEKKIKTTQEHYGVDYPFQDKEIKKQISEKRFKNGTILTSKVQLELFDLCKNWFPNCLVELNYPVSSLFLDIKLKFNDILIDLEYDGWYWHQSYQKDIARDNVVKKFGYKVIRIRSGNLLPTKEQLQEAIGYVSKENHYYKEIFLKDWKDNIDKK